MGTFYYDNTYAIQGATFFSTLGDLKTVGNRGTDISSYYYYSSGGYSYTM